MSPVKFIFLFLLFFLISEISVSQNKKTIVENIRDEIEDIHLDTALKSVTLINDEFLDNMPDGGGELTGFYNKKGISRIYKSIGISFGVGITEFYYKKNKLIFIREKFNSYVYDDNTKSFDYTKLNNTYSGSFYFNKDKIIDSTVKGSRSFKDNSKGTEISLNEESAEAYKLISDAIIKKSDSKK